MKNSVVLHVNTASPNGTSPTMRIARFVAEELGIPLVCSPESAAPFVGKRLDRVFVKYGILKFSDHREEAVTILNRARTVINLENDYLMDLDKRLRRPDLVWSTIPDGRDAYVNWNILTRWPLDTWSNPPVVPEPREAGVIYYGAHRAGRTKYFERYFKEAPYPVTISTFRGGKAFRETCGDDIAVIGAFKRQEQAAAWRATVYIEDEQSHTLFTSLATRFYECLQIGLPQFVDIDCLETFKSAGLPVPEHFIVSCARSLKRLLPQSDRVIRDQRALWWHAYDSDIRCQLTEAVKSL